MTDKTRFWILLGLLIASLALLYLLNSTLGQQVIVQG
jgi:hypothetical protein